MIVIKERDIDSFFEVPFNIYQDAHFVSLFKEDIERFLSEKNPLFRSGDNFTYFTALENGRAIGRIVGVIHGASNKKHNLNWAYFGYFDCANRIEVAQVLVDKVIEWAKSKGHDSLVGNINFTFMQQIGVVVDGFDNFPYSDQVYSPEYLPGLLNELGFESFFPMVTGESTLSEIDMMAFEKPKILALEDDPDIHFKEVGYFGIQKFMKDGCQVLNEGFANNPYFTPLNIEEFQFQAKDLMLIIDPGLTILAYKKNKPIGVIICIPDLNPLLHSVRSKMGLKFIFKYFWFKLFNDRAVIIFYSVSPEFQGRGLNQAILKKVLKNLKRKGYKKLGMTWIADVNKSSLRQMEMMSGKVLHRLNLFKKNL